MSQEVCKSKPACFLIVPHSHQHLQLSHPLHHISTHPASPFNPNPLSNCLTSTKSFNMLTQNILIIVAATMAGFASTSPLDKVNPFSPLLLTIPLDSHQRATAVLPTQAAQAQPSKLPQTECKAPPSSSPSTRKPAQLLPRRRQMQGPRCGCRCRHNQPYSPTSRRPHDGDIKHRQVFNQQTVFAVAGQFPTKNVVMRNVGYSLRSTSDVLQKTNYKAKVGSNISFDV